MEAFLRKRFWPPVTYGLLIIPNASGKALAQRSSEPLCYPCTGTSCETRSLLHGRGCLEPHACLLAALLGKSAVASWWGSFQVIIPHTFPLRLF